MIEVSSEIIGNTLSFIFRDPVEVLQKFKWVILLKQTRAIKKFEIIWDISLMMFAVVNFHCLSINMRLKGIIRISKSWERMSKHIMKIRKNKRDFLNQWACSCYQNIHLLLQVWSSYHQLRRHNHQLSYQFLWLDDRVQLEHLDSSLVPVILPENIYNRWILQGAYTSSPSLLVWARVCRILFSERMSWDVFFLVVSWVLQEIHFSYLFRTFIYLSACRKNQVTSGQP